MRIPQIWTLLIDSPKIFDIAPKINLLERSDWSRRSVTWLLFSSSQIIELIFCILNYFENLRFEQWIEQVRTNVRHVITVRGPLYVTICNLDGHVIRMGPSLVDRPSNQSAALSGLERDFHNLVMVPRHPIIVHGRSVADLWTRLPWPVPDLTKV